MPLHTLNPLEDPRWKELVERHPRASVFHTVGWLEALRRTYGYEPIVFTTSSPRSELKNGVVFCQIESWVTGRRLVSLPFSDHCDPLVADAAELQKIMEPLLVHMRKRNWKFLEIRPRTRALLLGSPLGKSEGFAFHTLDLTRSIDEIHKSFNKDSVIRRIRRAEREPLQCEEGRTPELLAKFYELQMVTRRRHQIPPQPLAWFKNLSDCMGDSLKIRVASKDGENVASILTLNFSKSYVYKYGASDASHNHLGGTLLLLWRGIQEAKSEGIPEFDWGKSDLDNPGLIGFKDNWGTERTEIAYARFPAPAESVQRSAPRNHLTRAFFSYLPDRVLTAAGRALYRHIG